MTKIMVLFVASGLLAIASACGADSVEASAYDQTCSADSECVLVDELNADGSTCSIRCASGVINKKELSRYEDDLNHASSDCRSTARPFCDLAGAAVCAGGKCAFAPFPLDAGTD